MPVVRTPRQTPYRSRQAHATRAMSRLRHHSNLRVLNSIHRPVRMASKESEPSLSEMGPTKHASSTNAARNTNFDLSILSDPYFAPRGSSRVHRLQARESIIFSPSYRYNPRFRQAKVPGSRTNRSIIIARDPRKGRPSLTTYVD